MIREEGNLEGEEGRSTDWVFCKRVLFLESMGRAQVGFSKEFNNGKIKGEFYKLASIMKVMGQDSTQEIEAIYAAILLLCLQPPFLGWDP